MRQFALSLVENATIAFLGQLPSVPESHENRMQDRIRRSQGPTLADPTVPHPSDWAETPFRRRLVTGACMMAIFMAAVEGTIVATAMPTIVAELGGFRL